MAGGAPTAGQAGHGAPGRRAALVSGHLAAGLVVVAAVVAELTRPLAPDPGPALDAGRFFAAAHLARVDAYREPLRWVLAARFALLVAVPALLALTGPGRRLVARCGARPARRPNPATKPPGRRVGLLRRRRRAGRSRRGRAAAHVALLTGVLTALAVLPLDLWAGWVHERAFGLSTQGLGGWAVDWLLAVGPGLVLLAGGAGFAWWLAGRLPRGWPPVLALLGAALTVVLVTLAPLLLEPLRFRFTPLPDGPVRAAVAGVLDAAGEEVEAILVADASRRTTRQNAYVSGIGATRRVVLYDTLLAQRGPEEVAIVLAHELGHRRHGDIARGALLAAAGAVASTYAAALLVRRRRRPRDGDRRPRGGDRRPLDGAPEAADPALVPAVLALLIVLTIAASPLQTWASRRAEAAADRFALDSTQDPTTFSSAITELTGSNLTDPDPPAWVVALAGSHPTPAARLTMASRWP